jgi:hypothetical protein
MRLARRVVRFSVECRINLTSPARRLHHVVSLQESALDQLPPGGMVDYTMDGPEGSAGLAGGLPRLGSFSEFREMEAALPVGGEGL